MSLHVLVIDDQIARSEEEQISFLRAIGEITGYADERRMEGCFNVIFCSGQRLDGNQAVNDVQVAVDSVGHGKDWALVLLDMQFDSGCINFSGIPGGQPGDTVFGGKIERELLKLFPSLPVVRFSGKSEQELDRTDRPYLAKLNLTPDEFRFTLLSHGKLDLQQKWDLLELDPSIVIASPVMFDVYCQARKLSPTDDPVLILGETGTGKEVIAQYIHHHSGRADNPFIPVNVAAMPDKLADSEFFGHEKGSFTGAEKNKKGFFEQTGGGTIFLDEIGDMIPEHQLRLLRVLQERRFRRIGGTSSLLFDGRVILATHRDLEQRIQEGRFREDLYNRLTLNLMLPPLRHRREEIIPLANRFLAEAAVQIGKQGISLDDSAHQRLLEYSFPGNIRELRAMMKIVSIATGNNRLIQADDLPMPGRTPHPNRVQIKAASIHQTLNEDSDQRHDRKQILTHLEETLQAINIVDENSLTGIKPRLEKIFKELLKDCTAVCLDRCRHPVTQKISLLPAIQILTGDLTMKGTKAKRIFNEILGRNKGTAVTQEEMVALCNTYLSNKRTK